MKTQECTGNPNELKTQHTIREAAMVATHGTAENSTSRVAGRYTAKLPSPRAWPPELF
jgi:hypothetical protein